MTKSIRPILIGATALALLLAIHGADPSQGALAQTMGGGQGNQAEAAGPNHQRQQSGPGMMGPGMMEQGLMHPGMMGPGMMGQGMMGQGMMHPGMIYGMPGHYAQEITPDQVREMLQRRLDWHANPRLKLGEIKPTEYGEILADIVTQEGSLVQRLAVDRRTGALRQVD